MLRPCDAVVVELLRLVDQLATLEGRPQAELAELAGNSAQPLAVLPPVR